MAKKASKKTTVKTKPKKSAKVKDSSTEKKKVPVKAARIIPEGPRKFEKVSTNRTKSQVVETISVNTGLSKKEVKLLLETLRELIGHDLQKSGPGSFNLPGLLKVRVVNKPASRSRKGVNPFTGEAMVFKAKPARNIVRIRPLKALKEMV
ncbi:MAG: HU family DNA-binding protein [Proteobacteria bacterium]|nr:HU family DNA-binding protein [Pseudomonadota bacterium]